MLPESKIVALIPTINPERSRVFYENILGLNLISESQFALEFEHNGGSLRITIVQEFTPHPFATLGFRIDEIELHVKSLIQKGVQFERYSSLQQNDLGIWTSPSGAQVAWFKDPDGNLLSVTEYSK